MRILHLVGARKLPRNPDLEGASGVMCAVLETARAQARLGHQVLVAGISKVAWSTAWHGVELLGLKVSERAILNIGSKTLDLRQHFPYMLLSHKREFDVIQGHIYSYMRFLRARSKVVHFHTDPFYPGRNNEGVNLKPADFLNISRYSQAQVAVSHFVAEEVKRGMQGLGNVHMVYNGVDWSKHGSIDHVYRNESRKKWGYSDKDVVFLFAGAIVKEKGAIHLARAFACLAKNFPHIHLLIAGSSSLWGGTLAADDLSDKYEDQVQLCLHDLLRSGRVHLLGKVAASRMPHVYMTADIVVVPSVCREAFSIVAAESSATGLPVIASNTGGLTEVINGSTGILVEPGDELALMEAMHTLAVNQQLRIALGSNGHNYARKFSWDKTAVELDNVYRTIITV